MSNSSPFPIGLFPNQGHAPKTTPIPQAQELDGSLQGRQPSSLQGIVKLAAVLQELASKPKGLVLITGPTGSGKSTTLAAMID